MGTASFPAPAFGQERYSGQQDKAPKKKYPKKYLSLKRNQTSNFYIPFSKSQIPFSIF